MPTAVTVEIPLHSKAKTLWLKNKQLPTPDNG